MFNPRERLEKFKQGLGVLSKDLPDTTKAAMDFIHTGFAEGKLTVREKELVAIGLAVFARCEDCIVFHVYNALQAGCTREEILEAAGVAMTFGGGPTLGAISSLLLDSIDEFSKD